MYKIHKGGNIIKKGNRYYVIISSNVEGLQEIEVDDCRNKDTHYFGEKGVCLVCGSLRNLRSELKNTNI